MAKKTCHCIHGYMRMTGYKKEERDQCGAVEATATATATAGGQAFTKGGRPRLADELALDGIVIVMRTGIPREDLPQELGFRSGMTCWRRMQEWQVAGAWHRLHLLLLANLRGVGRLDFSRACMEGASSPSRRGGRTPGPTLRTAASSRANAIA